MLNSHIYCNNSVSSSNLFYHKPDAKKSKNSKKFVKNMMQKIIQRNYLDRNDPNLCNQTEVQVSVKASFGAINEDKLKKNSKIPTGLKTQRASENYTTSSNTKLTIDAKIEDKTSRKNNDKTLSTKHNGNNHTIKECKSIERFTKISKIIDEKNTK